jgi:hypothetical protein
MRRFNKHWRVVVTLSGLGLLVACLYVAYFWITEPNPNPKIVNTLVWLCPPAYIVFVCIDTPCTTVDYAELWTFAALLNGAIYGVLGAFIAASLSKLRAVHEGAPR